MPSARRLSPTPFYLRSAVRFAILPICRRALRGRYQRTPSAVRAEYDPQRSEFLERFRQSDWSLDEYVMREAGDDLDTGYYFAKVLDGRLVQGHGDEVRRRLLQRLKAAVQKYEPVSIAEVGSGTGRNILFLKGELPHIEATGLDLSSPSVLAAREAACRYGIDARFEICDASGPWPMEAVDVVFSVHAVEQFPQSETVLSSMVHHARKAVVLFEPLPDLWRGLPGFAARLRVSYLDRLRAGAVDAFDVRQKTLLPEGMALNRTSEIHLAPAAPRA